MLWKFIFPSTGQFQFKSPLLGYLQFFFTRYREEEKLLPNEMEKKSGKRQEHMEKKEYKQKKWMFKKKKTFKDIIWFCTFIYWLRLESQIWTSLMLSLKGVYQKMISLKMLQPGEEDTEQFRFRLKVSCCCRFLWPQVFLPRNNCEGRRSCLFFRVAVQQETETRDWLVYKEK